MTTTTRENPVYLAALESRPNYVDGPRYISTTDTAKLIRATLAKHWPAVRFSVRSESYAGGSSINVSYDGVERDARGRALVTLVDYDGARQEGAPIITQEEMDYSRGRYGKIPRPGLPTAREVEAELGGFSGQRFDGMIDMAYGVSSWLNPDGSATLGESAGTGGSHGSDPGYSYSRETAGALLVRFGASYVFVRDE